MLASQTFLEQECSPEQLTLRDTFRQAEAQRPQAWLPLGASPRAAGTLPGWPSAQDGKGAGALGQVLLCTPPRHPAGTGSTGQHCLQGAQMGEIC